MSSPLMIRAQILMLMKKPQLPQLLKLYSKIQSQRNVQIPILQDQQNVFKLGAIAHLHLPRSLPPLYTLVTQKEVICYLRESYLIFSFQSQNTLIPAKIGKSVEHSLPMRKCNLKVV